MVDYHGHTVICHTAIQSPDGFPLPVRILDNESSIQPTVSAASPEIRVSQQADDVLELVWDFGRIVIPQNDTFHILQLKYTAVVLDNDISNITIKFIAHSFAFGILASSSEFNAITLVPKLLVRGSAMASISNRGLEISLHCYCVDLGGA